MGPAQRPRRRPLRQRRTGPHQPDQVRGETTQERRDHLARGWLGPHLAEQSGDRDALVVVAVVEDIADRFAEPFRDPLPLHLVGASPQAVAVQVAPVGQDEGAAEVAKGLQSVEFALDRAGANLGLSRRVQRLTQLLDGVGRLLAGGRPREAGNEEPEQSRSPAGPYRPPFRADLYHDRLPSIWM